MTINKQRLLKEILEPAIEFNSCNVYQEIINSILSLPVELKNEKVSINQLYKALIPLSKKWDKGIDKVIGL